MKTITREESKAFDFSFITLFLSLLLIFVLVLVFSIDTLTTKEYPIHLHYFFTGTGENLYSFTVPKIPVWYLLIFLPLTVFGITMIKMSWQEIKKSYWATIVSCLIGIVVFLIVKLVFKFSETDLFTLDIVTICLFLPIFVVVFTIATFTDKLLIICFSSFFIGSMITDFVLTKEYSLLESVLTVIVLFSVSFLINLMFYSMPSFLIAFVQKIKYVLSSPALGPTYHETHTYISED